MQSLASPFRRKTILVVEDDRSTSDLVRDALEAEGYRCVPATEGHLALEMARDERPSLITLDLDLPDTDGHAVLHTLRQDASTRDIPIVVISAFARMLPEPDRAGLAGVLAKPFDPAALAGAVRSALADPIG
jgi:two-component system, OmpR family, alkaline phosphatase synthesis response regulator PhoP